MPAARAVRRTSGEIINATLLEVFLSIAFIVFALATFEHRRALAAERALNGVAGALRDSAQNAIAMTAMRDSLRQIRTDLAARDGRLRAMDSTVRALRFNSRYAPDCEAQAGDSPWVTVTLREDDMLTVRVRDARLGFVGGQELDVSSDEFPARFAPVRQYSEAQGCRFRAEIVDTDRTSKVAYKRALAAVSTTFRLRGFLR